jgi:hypothetical protein
MGTPKSSNCVTGERTGSGDGRGWRWRMDVLAATMIAAAVLPTACTANEPASSSSAGGSTVVQKAIAGANVSPNSPQFRHAPQVCTKIAPW